MQQITSLLHIYTNMKDSTIEQAYDLFISRFEDSLNDVFKNNRNTILFENANPEQELMDNVIQCIIYKMHTEYTLKKIRTRIESNLYFFAFIFLIELLKKNQQSPKIEDYEL